jgi:hypothetical protein
MSNPVTFYRSKKDAAAACGNMSQTSKMGCQSFGLPIAACNVGSKLRNIPGSTCSKCYAGKGAYAQYAYTVLPAQENRLALLRDALSDTGKAWAWAYAIVRMIGKDTHFRWHDAGDLQSLPHLELIAQVAVELPAVKFWLPTREKAVVLAYLRKHGSFPANLVVRVSATMIDSAPPAIAGTCGSAVYSDKPIGLACISPQQNGECRACRACWSAAVPVVSYHVH